MRLVTRTLAVLAVGFALLALVAGLVVWQWPALQGTITVGDGDVTLHGFDALEGGDAAWAVALVVAVVVGALIATAVAVAIGLGAAALGLAVALLAVAGSLLVVAAPLLLVGALVWLALRPSRPRPTAAAVGASATPVAAS